MSNIFQWNHQCFTAQRCRINMAGADGGGGGDGRTEPGRELPEPLSFKF